MQTENRLFDDLARMANGALNTLSGLREEIENRVRERVERMLSDMDMVPREEFDAVKAMAQTARTEQEALAAKVAELEARLSALAGAPAAARAGARRKGGAARTAEVRRRQAGQAGRGAAAPDQGQAGERVRPGPPQRLGGNLSPCGPPIDLAVSSERACAGSLPGRARRAWRSSRTGADGEQCVLGAPRALSRSAPWCRR